MTLTAYDPNDTGEILADGGLAPAVTETARITYDEPTDHLFGEGTRDLTHHAVNGRRPAAHPELAHDTGELPLTGPTGAERAVAALHVQQPRPGQPSGPATPTGPSSPPPGPPPPVATDDKPPPGTEPPKPAPTPSRLVDGILGVPVLRPAVPEYVGRHRTVRLGWGYWLATGALALVCGAAGGGAVLLAAVTW